MKKATYLAGLFLISALFVLPVQAAVESGGAEYLWGRAEGGNVKISADRGCTYAELPGLGEEAERTGLSYDVALYPLEDGGLRVEARDRWSTERIYQRDYSGAQITQLLTAAQPTPKKVLCTNGNMTVAVGYVEDHDNGDWTVANQYGWAKSNCHTSFFYSTDGVTWTAAEQEITASTESGWWDGTAFRVGYFTSADGVHWTYGDEYQESPELALSTDLGPYHFEYDQGTGEVYLMDRTAADTGVLLPHMGEAIRASMEHLMMDNRRAGSVRAWYGPNDTVYLAVYGIIGEKALALIDYPISSLDWCLENLKTQFRTIEPEISDGTMALGRVDWDFRLGWRGWTESRLACNNGSGWKWAESIPSGKSAQPLFCEGGYFWVKGEGHHLYRSADGQTWLLSDALRPSDQGSGSETYLKYQIAATESGFIASRHGGVSQHGMMGHSGGNWYEGYSRVYLLDKEFSVTDSYDFGCLVEAVGYLDGAYYARVANSEGRRNGWASYDEDGNEREPKVFDSSLGSTLYRSVDGKTWETLPDIYMDLDTVLMETQPIELHVWDEPLHSVAQLDRWRFLLSDKGSWYYDEGAEEWRQEDIPGIYLQGSCVADWVELPDMRTAIRTAGLAAGELTAAYNPDGTVEVKVTDRNDPARFVSISYPTDSLDWVKENLIVISGRVAYDADEAVLSVECKPNVADVAQLKLYNGETELVYRSGETDGKYMWYENGPWGNKPKLLPFSGKDFMVCGNGGLYLSSDGVNWRKADSEWLEERLGRNTFPYAFVWTGDKYLVGFDPFHNGGGGEGAGYELKDMGKIFFLDGELNLLSEYDFTQYEGTSSPAYLRRNVSGVGCADGVCYALLSGDYQGVKPDGVYYTGEDEPVLYRSADGLSWEKTDILQVRKAMSDAR